MLCVLYRLLFFLWNWITCNTCKSNLLILVDLSAVAIPLGFAVIDLALKYPMGMTFLSYHCGDSQPLQFFLETDIFY